MKGFSFAEPIVIKEVGNTVGVSVILLTFENTLEVSVILPTFKEYFLDFINTPNFLKITQAFLRYS